MASLEQIVTKTRVPKVAKDTAIVKCPKDKLFREYIGLELQLQEFDRCRKLYEKFPEFNPANCTTWVKYAELETILGDTERARALFKLAVNQPLLDMPEVLWKAYRDFSTFLPARHFVQHETNKQRRKHAETYKNDSPFKYFIQLKGDISYQAALKDQVELLIKPTKDVTNVIVEEKEDGNIRLKFTPKVPGAYSVEVKIDGEKLPTCPFILPVKEGELVVVGELDLNCIQGQELKGSSGIAPNREGGIAVVDNLGHCVFVFNKEGNCLRLKLEKKEQILDNSNIPPACRFSTTTKFSLQIN
ncbi:Crooked neck-like protein 1 [Stylophora pistillata]|uniref:Crooked neck-like protein 1 n=1 Tax=Stylophora pistillata TaxID=50429 RepID=A0A2B4S3N5_STYPI|nr:Crooked neck-like protein 1 [Stylophora pistillata]